MPHSAANPKLNHDQYINHLRALAESYDDLRSVAGHAAARYLREKARRLSSKPEQCLDYQPADATTSDLPMRFVWRTS